MWITEKNKQKKTFSAIRKYFHSNDPKGAQQDAIFPFIPTEHIVLSTSNNVRVKRNKNGWIKLMLVLLLVNLISRPNYSKSFFASLLFFQSLTKYQCYFIKFRPQLHDTKTATKKTKNYLVKVRKLQGSGLN